MKRIWMPPECLPSLMPDRGAEPELIISEAITITFRSCHFLQGDMNLAVPDDPIFGIGQIPDKSKKDVPSIPNIWVTGEDGEMNQHIVFQKKSMTFYHWKPYSDEKP